jgi:chromosome segregation ATPase
MTHERGELEAAIASARSQGEAAEGRCGVLEGRAQELEARGAEAESVLARARQEVSDKEGELAGVREQLEQAQAEAVRMEEEHANALSASKTQNSQLKEKVKVVIEAGKKREKETGQRLEQLRAKCEALEKIVAELTAQLADKDADVQQAVQDMTTLAAQMNSKDAEVQEAQEARSRASAYESQASELSALCTQLSADKDALVLQVSTLQEAAAANNSECASDQDQLIRANEQVQNLQVAVTQLEEQVRTAKEQAAALDQQLSHVQQEKEALMFQAGSQHTAVTEAEADSQMQLEQHMEKAEEQITQFEAKLQESMDMCSTLQAQVCNLNSQLAEKDARMAELASLLEKEQSKVM